MENIQSEDAESPYELCPIKDPGDKADDCVNSEHGKSLRANGTQKTARPKRNHAAAWRTVWYNFSQNTTLHGVNKVTEETPFSVRRVIWALIVMLGIALFVNQLVSSILFYMAFPVTVNVKINYNDTLVFPAVSICNQNDFRTTAAADEGMYHLVESYYQSLGTGGVNLSDYNATHMSLEDLYYAAAHRMEDMIVSCSWDEKPCNLTHFEHQLTDYGVCFTFNSMRNEHEDDVNTFRNVSRTGADRGLRMTINIEQYEYMIGPNPGAGLKVLIHDNTEVPLVRDLGHAIPPGTHAYVGVQIVEVRNLPWPHGRCNDSVDLEYYTYYSIPACMVECKEKYIFDNCGCRDVYMRNGSDGNPPVCDLETYQNCTVKFMEHFYDVPDRCICPQPCKRLMFDSTISYAYTSTYDAEVFLRGGDYDITTLQAKFIKARETVQRVNDIMIEDNIRMINEFNAIVTEVDTVLNEMSAKLDKAHEILEARMAELDKRIHFHKAWGLEKVKYAADHNFVRGWVVFEERTLDYVTTNYQEVSNYVKSSVQQAKHLSTEDESMRKALYVTVDRDLFNKMLLGRRAVDNITEAISAYQKLEPLLSYLVSPSRRYDMTYISQEVVQSSTYFTRSYFSKLLQRTNEFINATENLRSLILPMLTSGDFDEEAIGKWCGKFEAAARSYNYYKFIVTDRIIKAPTQFCDGLLEDFDSRTHDLKTQYRNLNRSITDTLSFLSKVDISWSNVRYLSELASEYLKNQTKTKTNLAEEFTSKEARSDLKTLELFFGEARAISRDMTEALGSDELAYQAVWTSMLTETTTAKFYQMVYDDIHLAKTNNSWLLYLDGKFGHMIGESAQWVREHIDDMYVRMNGDFPITNLQNKTQEIHDLFHSVSHLFVLSDVIGDKDLTFMKKTQTLQNNLEAFLKGNAVGHEFYRNNFMHLDVFMKELSYEVIEQQPAYDTTSLWSDIGGSMGLFIGASVLTAFELLDVIIHNFFKLHYSRQH